MTVAHTRRSPTLGTLISGFTTHALSGSAPRPTTTAGGAGATTATRYAPALLTMAFDSTAFG